VTGGAIRGGWIGRDPRIPWLQGIQQGFLEFAAKSVLG